MTQVCHGRSGVTSLLPVACRSLAHRIVDFHTALGGVNAFQIGRFSEGIWLLGLDSAPLARSAARSCASRGQPGEPISRNARLAPRAGLEPQTPPLTAGRPAIA